MRLVLMLLLGVVFALLPSANGDQRAGAATLEATVDSALPRVEAFSERLRSESVGAPVDISELFLAVRTQPASVDALLAVAPAAVADTAPADIDAVSPTTVSPTTVSPTTVSPTTVSPTTVSPTTVSPTTVSPTTVSPTTISPTTISPTTVSPTTVSPTTVSPTTVSPTTVPPLSLGEQALANISYDWQSRFPNWVVEFRGERAGIRGLTYPAERRIEIFIRSEDTVASVHRVLAHELGHLIDVELNNNDDRRRWAEQRGLASDTPWWPSAEAPDFATGAGDFAEAFAVLEAGIQSRSSVGSQPTSADLALLRELIAG